LRIVGGRWRGQRLPVPPAPGLRPTPDRVRETVFNWLQTDIVGARCLDLFAGSGALGLEAASRGAGEVVLVEAAAPVARQLREQVTRLQANGVEVRQQSAQAYLASGPAPFDGVFLDPPFDAELLEPICRGLDKRGLLKPGAWVYVEMAAIAAPLVLPKTWYWVRSDTAGDVAYGLVVAEKIQ